MSDTDLIADFFTRNLEVAEDAALAALLESSPEAAERFAGLAADDYQRLGLPAPVVPNPLVKRLKFGALGLACLAALFWWWNQPTQTHAVDVGVVPQADREVSLPQPSAEHRARRQADEDLEPRTNGQDLAPAGEAAVPRLSISMETRQGPFDVKVTGGTAQPVGVLDSGGNLVGRLTPAGPQAWAWDAKRRDGKPAGPGRYRICLLAGDRPLRQWVEIERR
jgi:hypothetical protein